MNGKQFEIMNSFKKLFVIYYLYSIHFEFWTVTEEF